MLVLYLWGFFCFFLWVCLVLVLLLFLFLFLVFGFIIIMFIFEFDGGVIVLIGWGLDGLFFGRVLFILCKGVILFSDGGGGGWIVVGVCNFCFGILFIFLFWGLFIFLLFLLFGCCIFLIRFCIIIMKIILKFCDVVRNMYSSCWKLMLWRKKDVDLVECYKRGEVVNKILYNSF